MKKRTSYIAGVLLVLLCAIYLLQEETGLISKVIPTLAGTSEPVPEGLMELPYTSDDDIILTHKGFVISYNA